MDKSLLDSTTRKQQILTQSYRIGVGIALQSFVVFIHAFFLSYQRGPKRGAHSLISPCHLILPLWSTPLAMPLPLILSTTLLPLILSTACLVGWRQGGRGLDPVSPL
jgi:hypothetical protein